MPPPETFAWVQDPLTYALVGLIGFTLAVLYAVIRGGLVPRQTVATYEKLWERRLEESLAREQSWKEAAELALASNEELGTQVDKLQVLGETTVHLLQSLPSARTT